MIKEAQIRQMVSPRHVIERLSVPRKTLMRWVDAGEFPKPHRFGRRILRWDAAEVEAWIEANRLGGHDNEGGGQ